MNYSEKVINILQETYPDARCTLEYETPFQLLIATILSAQSTDKSVNKLTYDLFNEYPDLDKFLTLTQDQIEEKIRKIGIYKNKSKNIYKLCKLLDEDFNGQVPDNIIQLIKLPGVGLKTASVVLAEAFNIPAFPVDTHVFRVTRRIGIAKQNTPDKVSYEMMEKLPKSKWIKTHHVIIQHGRQVCLARNPKCSNCMIAKYCNYNKEVR